MDNPLTLLKRRKEQEGDALSEFLQRRRYLNEDVTVFGEQMSELHVDTLTDTLTEDARDYYRYALESYDVAKTTLGSANDLDDLEPAAKAVVEGRHQRACVLALVAGQPMPDKLHECFFNPQHGPAHTEVDFTPPGGVLRQVPACSADANRLAHGQAPTMRLVRVGDRFVPMALLDKDDAGWFRSTVDKRAHRDGKSNAVGQGALYGINPGGSSEMGSGGPMGI